LKQIIAIGLCLIMLLAAGCGAASTTTPGVTPTTTAPVTTTPAPTVSTVPPVTTTATPTASPTPIEARLGEQYSLALGQGISFTQEQLSLQFVEVTAESRCPKGATCIRQGEVICLVQVGYFKSLHRLELVYPGLTGEDSRTTFNEFEFIYTVQPYPEVGKEIDRSDYRLQIRVEREHRLSNGILVTFDVVGEKYSIFITNPETIEQVLALQTGGSRATIPSGKLVRGGVPYNQPWSWHIDSEDIHMAEMTIELCDGIPSHVEENLDYWIETVQRFCPWSAVIVDIQDFREPVQETLQKQRIKWAGLNLQNYRYRLEVGCFCPVEAIGPVDIEVRNNATASGKYTADGRAVNNEFFQNYDTMDKLFKVIQDAINEEADSIKVTWDDQYGFPAVISLDPIKLAVDDERTLTVTNFSVVE